MKDREQSGKRNLIVFFYDSLIPSMIGALGGGVTTPAFDFFARGGAVFPRTIMSAARADMALASALTGLNPHRHGVHKMVTAREEGRLTRMGYLYDGVEDLTMLAARHGHAVGVFNLGALNPWLRFASWKNRAPASPHLAQLESFLDECSGGPFTLLDRFGSLAFPWAPPVSGAAGEGTREALAMAGATRAGREAALTRMKAKVEAEDRRLYQIIRLLDTRGALRDSAVALLGTPANHHQDEIAALNRLCGYDPAAPMSPMILWRPGAIKPSVPDQTLIRQIDLAPTLAALAGFEPQGAFDGTNLAPSLRKGNAPKPRDTAVFFDQRIVRVKPGGGMVSLPLNGAGASSKAKAARLGIEGLAQAPRINAPLLRDPVIPKTTIFFLARARSGTVFFANLFGRQEFNHALIKGHCWPHLLEINARYHAGALDDKAAMRAIVEQNSDLLTTPREVIVSVTHDAYYLTPLLPKLFPNSKFVFITRDPRHLIRSHASLPWMTQRAVTLRPLATAHLYEAMPANIRGKEWTAWAADTWTDQSRRYYDLIQSLGPRGLMVKFEDIFDPARGFPGVNTIASFIADEIRMPVNPEWTREVFTEKQNSFTHTHPAWDKWGAEEKNAILERCGPLMKRMGYAV